MAPEQRSGSVDARSDQFALCVALAEALTGKRPRADEKISLPGSIGSGSLPSVLRRGLHRDPAARFPSMTALADALVAAIAPRPSPLRRLLPVGVLVLLGGALAVFLFFGRASRAPGDRCEVAALPAGLWTPARRSALGAQPGRLDRRLDTWVAAWSAASADVCAVALDDPTARARQRACLAASADSLAGLLTRWEAAPPADPMPALGAIDALPRASRCSRAAVVAEPVPAMSQAVRVHLLRPWVHAAGKVEVAARLVGSARAVGHAPFVVEAMIALATREGATDRDAAIKTLRDAVGVAERAGAGWSLVDASIPLISLLGADGTEEAVALADAARARIAALGGDPALEAELDHALADVWRDARRHTEATVALERALRGFRAAYGPDDPHEALALVALGGVQAARDSEDPRARATMDRAQAILDANRIDMPVTLARDAAGLVAQTRQLLAMAQAAGSDSEAVVGAHYNLAIAYTLTDEREEALAQYQKASQMGEELGLRDARMVESLSQSSALLIELGRASEGIAPARRAVRRAEELGLQSELGASLSTLGWALLEADQPAAARDPLRRALAIRERLKESGRFRGNTRFLLARALWSADRERARGMAQAARLDMVGFLEVIADDDPNAATLRRIQGERLAEIDRWLDSHR
jgi:tetratricopeptide (TPR) repeat protein